MRRVIFAAIALMLGALLAACGPEKPKNPVVVLETTDGTIEIEMFPDVAPKTVEHFLKLVNEGFYDSLLFSRVVPGFVIQAGDPTSAGRERPEFTIDGEPNDSTHGKGRVGMALVGSDINSGSTQFYICIGDKARVQHLDQYNFTVFGEVDTGWTAVEKIATEPTSGSIQRIMGDTAWRAELLRLAETDSADIIVVRDTIPIPDRPLRPVRIIKAYQKQ